ncbi:hypothetical protein COB28_01425 [Candidatus Dependentiae bacterium]|nr:MAG: hypothetical protein COB28_01425 [Candidatus Dependentiae bacterium]
MKSLSYKDILSFTKADTIAQYSIFVLVAEDPSVFIASLIRKKIVSLCLIQDTTLFDDSKKLVDALSNVSLFATESELFWLTRKYDGIQKKEAVALQKTFNRASKEKRIFCLLNLEEYSLFNWDDVSPLVCHIKLPNTLLEDDIRFLFSQMNKKLSEEKLSYLIDCCNQYEINSFDYVYVSLLMFSSVHARYLPKVKNFFEKNWFLQASKKNLFDAFIESDKNKFFQIWDSLYEEHSISFWIFFWFETVVKILHYKSLIEQGKWNIQKVFRDQFFYVQCEKNAQYITKKSLLDFLHGLYVIDIRSKEYGEGMGLDMLLLDFFLKNE